MQYADITLCIAGDINFQVEKPNVSVAEIALLRELHGGPDAVRNVRPTERRRDPMHSAKRALLDKYALSPKTHEVIERLWPGMSPMLPKTLEDIGLELDPATLDTRSRKGPQVISFAGPPPQDDPEAETDDGTGYAAQDAAKTDDDEQPAPAALSKEDEKKAAYLANMERGRALARAARGE